MNEQIIGILPFISFSEEIIHIDEFLIFSDSKIQEINELSEGVQGLLNDIAQKQKSFMQDTYGNQEIKITFIITTNSTATQKACEQFVDIIFFFMHKGGKSRHLLSAPNVFCREDFKLFILTILDSDSSGQFLAKKKFKFHMADDVNEYIILPSGCENAIAQNQQYGFIFREVDFNYQSDVFQYLYQVFCDNQRKNLLQAISFYNKALSCDQTDPERFVWISSSLEAFFQIGKQSDKKRAIKQEVENLLKTKDFQVIEKEKAINYLAKLISLVYDYRSSYIHCGEILTENTSIESELALTLGKLDFIIGIMDFVSVLLLNEVVPDNRIESVLHRIFYNQKCFEQMTRIYKNSADLAISKLQMIENVSVIHRFAFIADLQTISFDRDVIEKCLDNILRIFAQFARDNKGQPLAIEIQQQINNVDFNDVDKLLKWNVFLESIDVLTSPIIPEYVFTSILVFKLLFRLFQYEFALY